MQDAWRAYLEMALGVTETSRKKAQKVAKKLVGKGGATAAQLSALAEDIVSNSAANREALTKMVRAEVERALGKVGLANADEVSTLGTRVRELEQQLREAKATAAAPAAPVAEPVPTPVGAEAIAPASPAPAATTAAPAPAKKAVKKAIAKRITAKKAPVRTVVANKTAAAGGTDGPSAAPAKKAPAPAKNAAAAPAKNAPVPAKKAAAKKVAKKVAPAKKAGPAAMTAPANTPLLESPPFGEGGPAAAAPSSGSSTASSGGTASGSASESPAKGAPDKAASKSAAKKAEPERRAYGTKTPSKKAVAAKKAGTHATSVLDGDA